MMTLDDDRMCIFISIFLLMFCYLTQIVGG